MHVPRVLLLSILLICSSLSGCLSGDDVDEIIEIDSPVFGNFGGAYSVVAPIDTGINVYHERFILNETLPDWLLEGLGVTMTCNLTMNGTWEERYESDKEDCWDLITSSDIVYFPGTRIIGTTPDDGTDIPILDDLSLIHI